MIDAVRGQWWLRVLCPEQKIVLKRKPAFQRKSFAALTLAGAAELRGDPVEDAPHFNLYAGSSGSTLVEIGGQCRISFSNVLNVFFQKGYAHAVSRCVMVVDEGVQAFKTEYFTTNTAVLQAKFNLYKLQCFILDSEQLPDPQKGRLPRAMDFVLERLAIGDITDARSLPKNITALLNCTEEHNTRRDGIRYLKIPLVDFQPINPEYILPAVRWIKEVIANNTVLVHCNAGIGRSPSIVVCYLSEIGFGFEEAVRLVKSKRPDALPHRDLRSAFMLAKKMASYE